jgi:hypothetical protein
MKQIHNPHRLNALHSYLLPQMEMPDIAAPHTGDPDQHAPAYPRYSVRRALYSEPWAIGPPCSLAPPGNAARAWAATHYVQHIAGPVGGWLNSVQWLVVLHIITELMLEKEVIVGTGEGARKEKKCSLSEQWGRLTCTG